MTRVVYLDASAIVKQVLEEQDSEALGVFLSDRPIRVASAIAVSEVRRAVLRGGDNPDALARTDEVFERIDLVGVTRPILERAGRLAPATLRILDAIHLATALELGPIDAFVTYDDRQAEAARAHGIAIAAPH